jgi:excisionase family DNA binding protein
MDKQLYSTEEAAEILGVTSQRVRQMIGEGVLPSVKVGKVNLITSEGIKRARTRKQKPGPAARIKKQKVSL